MTAPDMLAQSRGRYVFDTETNGFLEVVTILHCAVMGDIDTQEVHDFGPTEKILAKPATYPLSKFREMYQSANMLIGHNIISFDMQVIEKLYGIFPHPTCEIIDTLNLARLVFSDIKATDFLLAATWKKYREGRDAWATENDTPYPYPAPLEFPGNFVGLHSLEAWGYRMGAERKGDYSKECKAAGIDPWAKWSPEMHSYMIQDATVNTQLYWHLMAQEPSAQSIKLEMDVQILCTKMERNGWPFNRKAAEELYSTLSSERESLAQELRGLFPPWTIQLDDFIPKRNNKTKGYIAGVPVERFETVEFNPASRQHIEYCLKAKYGWKPNDFTKGGAATIDDDVLASLPYPEAQQLARFFMLQKRIGQIAEGDKAWLKYVTKEGKVHGRYSTNGTVTGRAAHFNPNVGQVPAVGSEYGWDCRALFHVPRGWRQLGADQSGLELRCLGSFLAGFDAGAYIEIVLHGDIHWENAKAIWKIAADALYLDSWDDEKNKACPSKKNKQLRELAKTIIYAMLYGGQDKKLGSIVGKGRKAGAQIRARLEGKFPALKKLVALVAKSSKKKWLRGLDGRKVPVRSAHAALNSLLQSAGAVICKQWIVDAEKALLSAGLKHGWDGDFVFLGWIHDELQIAVRDGVDIELIQSLIIKAGREVGQKFPQWKCPTDVDTKIGMNWGECH